MQWDEIYKENGIHVKTLINLESLIQIDVIKRENAA